MESNDRKDVILLELKEIRSEIRDVLDKLSGLEGRSTYLITMVNIIKELEEPSND